MGVAGRSRDHVEELLSELESAYDSFPVNQTTVSVSADHYERAVERYQQGVARLDIHVHNDQNDVLLVENDDGLTVPGETISASDSLEQRARRAVRQATGVECRIESIQEVTIAGVHSEPDPDADPVYRLVVLLSGRLVSGTPTAGKWQADPPESELVI